MGGQECLHFPWKVPAKNVHSKITIENTCGLDSTCALYISFLHENVSIRGTRN